MPEPDERLAPAPPEVTPPPPEFDELPAGWRAVVPDLRPLRHADYRRLIFGQSVSFLGSMVTYVAVPYQVYRLTRSSLAVGLIGLVQMAAILSLAFLGGALADAVDRRRHPPRLRRRPGPGREADHPGPRPGSARRPDRRDPGRPGGVRRSPFP